MGFEVQVPMSLYCNNKAVINICHNPVQHDCTKHIEVDRHFIREKLLCGLICTPFIITDQQTIDILTKGVTKARLHVLTDKLDMYDIHTLARGNVEAVR